MKRLLTYFILIIIALPCFSEEKTVKLDISEVKIYLRGAELTSTAKIKLKPGNNEFILENIANEISPNSINASLSGNASIMDISEKRDYLNADEYSVEVQTLQDSLTILNYKISELTNEIQALDSKADILSQNRTISGKDKVMTALDLAQVSEFFYDTMLELKNSKLKLNKQITDIQKKTSRIQSQINEINTKNTKSIHQLLLTVNSKTSQAVGLSVKYFINEAGWSPFYDIRVDNINSPLTFNHKANVWQNSGVDFNDVRLVLSTRNPSIYGNIPTINPVSLDFADNHIDRRNYVSSSNSITSEKNTRSLSTGVTSGVFNAGDGFNIHGSRANENSIKLDGQEVTNAFTGSFGIGSTSYFATSISAEFITDLSYTILSDGKAHNVDLKASELPGTYEYYTAPKYRLESFLVAKVKDWADINLLPGSASVYFENSYIGKTDINPDVTLDTMSLSLGVDKGVIVSRDIIKDFTESKFLSKDIERFFAYKITVKNTKKTKIRITIEDQIPVSKNEDIKVELIEGSEGKLNSETGRIQWVAEIEPGKSLEKQLKFSVRHPSNRKISTF